MIFLLSLLPKRLLSFLTGCFASIRWPRAIARVFIPCVARVLKLAEAESELPFSEYSSVQALFTRNLKPNIRPMGAGLVSPVDGELREYGAIAANALFLVKGVSYRAQDLIGETTTAVQFQDGTFYNFYLCPRDYHHVHAPCDMQITGWRHIPGDLWPVNNWAIRKVKFLFNLNERIVVNFESEYGRGALVMVGALNVGNIRLTFDPSAGTTCYISAPTSCREFPQPILLAKGERLGTFLLGSSVVLMFQRSKLFSSQPISGLVRVAASLTN